MSDITILRNGLRVASWPMPHLATASVGIWVDVGARYEAAEVNGVAHMLEHMAFKGTRRRNARMIAEEIENVGGHLNAYTSREHTGYYARVLAEDVPLAVDILADILRESTFDPAELERERHVVLQEIGMVNDTPDDLVFDLFQEAAYPDHPLGRPILGPEAVVGKLPREALIEYMAAHYGPQRMVLAGAGKVEHARLVDLAERTLGDLPSGSGVQPAAAAYAGGERRSERDLEQVHLVLGFAAMPYTDPDFYALQVLSAALGGGMSSRLFQEVRENRGLAYSIYSFTASYRDTGLLGVYAGTGEDDAEELLPVVCGETKALLARIDEAELARSRAQLKASLLMSLESCAAMCDELARQVLVFGRRVPTEEIVAKVEAVDAAAIRRVGERLLSAPPTLAALGPLRTLPGLGGLL